MSISPTQLAEKVIKCELSPEQIKSMIVPSSDFITKFSEALRTEIEKSAEFNKETMAGLNKMCDNLIILVKDPSLNDSLKNRILDMVENIAKEIAIITKEKNKQDTEKTKWYIAAGVFVAGIIISVATRGKVDGSKILKS